MPGPEYVQFISALTALAADKGAEADGTTPLHRAVYARDLPQVQRLIAAGADVRAVNRFGASALQLAAVTADVPSVKTDPADALKEWIRVNRRATASPAPSGQAFSPNNRLSVTIAR